MSASGRTSCGLIALERLQGRQRDDTRRATHSALLSDVQPSQHRRGNGLLPREPSSGKCRWQAYRRSGPGGARAPFVVSAAECGPEPERTTIHRSGLIKWALKLEGITVAWML